MRIQNILVFAMCAVAATTLAADTRTYIEGNPAWLNTPYCQVASDADWFCAGENSMKAILRHGPVEVGF